MSLPLLQTKFYVPTLRTGLVARPQLLARLANNDLPPLTLISAPAGFGKTTLVSEWVQKVRSWLTFRISGRPLGPARRPW